MRKPKQLLILLIGASLLLLLLPLSVWGIDYLSNAGLEAPFDPYNTYNGWNLQVAHDWEKFVIDSYDNEDKLRYFSSCDWAAFNSGPDCERRDGEDAQVWWSSKYFDSGIYQQVSGLTIGEYYGFQTGILQVWETTGSQTHGMMFRSVGIDPYGGTSPTGANVIWGPEESRDVDWFYPGVGAQAMSTTMTVFVRVRSPNTAQTPHSNQVWVDDGFFDVAPTTAVNVQINSATEVTASWSGTPRSGFTLFAYEAQYRKLTDTTWTDLQIFDSSDETMPTDTSAALAVEAGVDYIVRARMWHEQDGGDEHEIPGPWTEALFNTAGNSFSNPGLESFKADGAAEDWETFSDAGTGNIITYTSAVTWAAQSGASPNIKEGNNAQVWTANQAFDAGIFQQVYSLTVGQTYGFAAYQAYSPTTASLTQNVGVDPSGGVDPAGPNVVWGLESNDPDWSLAGVGAEALSTTMTVFVRSRATDNAQTLTWADDTALGTAASTNLSLSNETPFQVQASWSSAPDAGYTLYAYESQYKPALPKAPNGAASDSDWTNLQILSDGPSIAASKSFTATAGMTYTARARSWQKSGSRAIPGPWVEETIIPQAQIKGFVFDNQGLPFKDVSVAVIGESLGDKSAGDGSFSFNIQPGNYVLTAAASSSWRTRAPVAVAVSNTQATSVTLTVIPPDDVIVNGAFEDGLNGWQHTFTQGITGSGYISAGLIISDSGSLSQTHTISNAYKPTLTFWYKIEGDDGVSSLTAHLFGRETLSPTASLVFTQSANGWQQAILPLNLAEHELDSKGSLGTPILPVPDIYSGALGVDFTVNISGANRMSADTPIFTLDEVALGSSQPEPEISTIYLPLAMKNYSPPAPPEPSCPISSTRTFDLIPVPDPPADHPDYLHGDLNLELRGYELVVGPNLGLEDGGGGDADPPQLPGLFTDDRVPNFSAAYQVYDWEWDSDKCGGNPHGCQGALLSDPETTLIGMQTTRSEEIQIPTRNSEIYGGGYKALVLYAEEKRITLSYLREDTVAYGYSVQIENVCVDPNLLALYQSRVDENGERITSGGLQLPALRNGDTLGTALTDETQVAIRDRGQFFDPRTRGDWWRGH